MTATIDPNTHAPSVAPPPRPGRRSQRTWSIGGIAMRMPFWVFTAAVAIIFLYPLIWTAVSSVAPRAGTNQVDGWGLGNYITLANYQDGVLQYIANSMVVSVLTVVLTLFISLLGGYSFARFNFRGKNALFLATIAILMVPYATLLIPLYVILNQVGLSNSLVGVALVLTMFQLPFSTFMMRISFESIPKELDEAAMVDGCTSSCLR
jgi:multiple sugar transport system permease protein